MVPGLDLSQLGKVYLGYWILFMCKDKYGDITGDDGVPGDNVRTDRQVMNCGGHTFIR
ncbi:hypothetical protein [Desulfosediminicola flagellatus]|uniref:hypothetical protein n=1 Tax=Desulfosediminicola flagellatus TaxID=2569541 RepID=UPI0012948057|nr:hypothetical protein [Desulfosediminicola flagellatus]